MEDAQFLTFLNMIAIRNGCRITRVDFAQHQVEIEGPEAKQTQCAMEIGELLQNYAV